MDYNSITRTLRTLPPRFHLDSEPAPGSVTLADLMADPARLADWMSKDAAAVGAPNSQVAASMLVQYTAMFLGGATLAAALLAGTLPIVQPGAIHVARGKATRWRFALTEPHLSTGDEESLVIAWVDHWIDGVLMDLVDAIRSTTRVGRRMLRDNVASAAGSSLVFLDWWEPGRSFDRLAPVLEAAGTPQLGNSLTMSRIEHRGRLGLKSERRSCCLHFQTEPPHFCPTCPKIDEEERERIMRMHLGHLDAVRSGGDGGPVTANR